MKAVPVLKDASIGYFREAHYNPEQPVVFPRGHFDSLPAIRKWFKIQDDGSAELNTYLKRHEEITVPLELTNLVGSASNGDGTDHIAFERIEAPLALFLEASARMSVPSQWDERKGPWIYLAQCNLWSLPAALQNDLPTPDVVKLAGKGDVYDSSIWLGRAPTFTSLHKDPNPNVFVQLAGRKTIRLTTPMNGTKLYHETKRSLHAQGHESEGIASIRGDEMMAGKEKDMLKSLVWDDGANEQRGEFMEADLQAGDGIFIPKGWWHSLVGVGKGMTGSVSCDLFYSIHSRKVTAD